MFRGNRFAVGTDVRTGKEQARSRGAGFLMWTWLSVLILIIGAEVNAELEHQTARDTTTGPPRAMGDRRAYVADTLGETAD